MSTHLIPPPPAPPAADREVRIAIPPLEQGDRLTRDEFERRYKAMPHVNKAELIEGIVYMPSPVSTEGHGDPQVDIVTWIGTYRARTTGVQAGDNATLRLDLDNEIQPDINLRLSPEAGGRARLVGGYLEGPPELIAEVAATTASKDLHQKLTVYQRNGVREYIVWRVLDQAIDWFVLRGSQFERLSPAADGVDRSEVFPGLWLDAAAMIRRNLARVLDVLQTGLASEDHRNFVETQKQKLAAATVSSAS